MKVRVQYVNKGDRRIQNISFYYGSLFFFIVTVLKKSLPSLLGMPFFFRPEFKISPEFRIVKYT